MKAALDSGQLCPAMVRVHIALTHGSARLRSRKGHEERFPPPRLSAGYAFRKETIAGMRRNGRVAPLPAVQEVAPEPPESPFADIRPYA